MKCPTCHYKETKVIDSRLSSDGNSIRRRRECLKCEKRYTTYEYIEQVPLMVVKKDGRRQPFDRTKIISGLVKACEKRPVSIDKIEEMTTEFERAIQRQFDREVNASVIGELIMEKLAVVDEVAYVRFASVYRKFKDVGQFVEEVKGLQKEDKAKPVIPVKPKVVAKTK